MLTDSQLKFLGDIALTSGQVCLASLVFPYFISGLSQQLLFLGVTLTATSWMVGLLIIKNVKNL